MIGQMSGPRVLKIEASAGSGKTYRLTNCFLKLLSNYPLSPQGLRKIVAITFTNKAAAEMKERVVKALKEITLGTEKGEKLAQETGLDREKARAWLEIVFEYYQDLQIRTIDSLVFTILKGVALELGLRPDLEAELREDLLLDRAYDRLLIALGEGDQDLAKLFREVLRTYLEIESRGGFNPERKIRKTLLDLFRYETKGRDLVPSEEYTGLEALAERLKALGRELVSKVKEGGGQFLYPRYRWEEKFLEPVKHIHATPFFKDSLGQVIKAPKSLIDSLEPLYTAFKKAREEYLLAKALVRLAPYALIYQAIKKELETLRQQEGLIHGGAWVELVEKVLLEEGVPSVYCKLGARFSHFLIDEFQDTSRRQWEVLFPLVEDALAQGGTFTYVVDIKQAIYVWRGGDPTLFYQVPASLPADLFEEPLHYNWRSRENIVCFNNKVFSLLAKEEIAKWAALHLLYGKRPQKEAQKCQTVEALAQSIQEVFAKVTQKLPAKDCLGGRIEIIPLEPAAKAQFSKNIQEKLAALLPEVFSRFTEQGRSIAILVRTNDQAEEIARFLFELGLPAVTENALRLSSSPLIRALIALLHFLDYPFHDVALTGFLQSEVARDYLSDGFWERVLALCRGRKGPLFELLRDLEPNFWQDYLKPLLDRAGLVSPYDLIREILAVFQIQERFPEEEAFIHRFLSLVLAFEQEGEGLSAFLERWEARGTEERLGLPEDLKAVRVLTIHAAKGLEFDAVFLPYLHWELKSPRMVTLEDGRLGYVQSPYPEPIKNKLLEEKAFQALEGLNLLYVAMTRAKEELYLFVPSEAENKYSRLNFGTGDVLRELLQRAGFWPNS